MGEEMGCVDMLCYAEFIMVFDQFWFPSCFFHQQITEDLIRLFQTKRGRGKATQDKSYNYSAM